MKKLPGLFVFLSLLLGHASAESPREWIDPDTGHRIVRLSTEADTASLYFHQKAFTHDGTRTVVITHKGIATINYNTGETKLIAPGVPYNISSSNGIQVGAKSGLVYFVQDGAVWSVDPETLVRRQVVKLPADGAMSDINADETLIAGITTESDPKRPKINTWPPDGTKMYGADGQLLTFAEMREVLINQRLEQRVPMTLFTLDVRTGAQKTILKTTDWLGHVQFSPTDPTLIMLCHEGNWHKVDRLWTIRTDGSGLTKLHTRTMNMEIAGHEFFGQDGGHIWYDLQTPRGEDFWLAGYEIGTGRRNWYHLERNNWSVHFNVSPDGSLFAGDGGDPEMAGRAPDGKWIWLFQPQTVPDVAGIKAPNAESLIHAGFVKAERLVNMGKHDYRIEPNVHFTPDKKWIIFRANFSGELHVYAVELAKAAKS